MKKGFFSLWESVPIFFLWASSRVVSVFKDIGKSTRTQFDTIRYYTVLFVLWLVISQPQLFEVHTDTSLQRWDVFAQAWEFSEDDEWALQFEMLMPGWDIGWQIVYVVRPGDTLSQIAKQFGTTTRILKENNSIPNPNQLLKGQKIEITYLQDEIIYEVQEKMTIGSFATQHSLNVDDLMTLNYFWSVDDELDIWYQIFLDLTREMAEQKWLWQAPIYERPEWLIEELPEEIPDQNSAESPLEKSFSWSLLSQLLWWSGDNQQQGELQEGDANNIDLSLDYSFSWSVSASWSSVENVWNQEIESISSWDDLSVDLSNDAGRQQNVINAVDTTEQLDEQERLKIEAIRKEEERLAAEKKKIEDEKKRQEEEKKRKEAEQVAQANKPAPAPTSKPLPKSEVLVNNETNPTIHQKIIKPEETTDTIEKIVTCWSNKCLHKGKCRKLPANGVCAPQDEKNARVCNEWYVEARRSCVEKSVYKEQTKTRGTQPVKSWTINQRYFNPYNDGYWNGRWGGHCTHYSWRYRWKHYGIMTNWRGNGWQWYWNASAAGRQVWQTPEVWAIFVADSWSWRRSAYGHVGIVIQVDRASNSILVEDMNYAWRYIVTQRRMSMSEKWMIGYVYPRKK